MNVAELAEAHYRTYVVTEEHPDWDDLTPAQKVTLMERMAIALDLEGVEGAYDRTVEVAPAYTQ